MPLGFRHALERSPEPADENEREALLAALDRALAEEEGAASGWLSAWWRSDLTT